MVSWIKSLFCNHKWKLVREVQELDYNFLGEKVVIGAYDIYVCQNCLKKKKIKY